MRTLLGRCVYVRITNKRALLGRRAFLDRCALFRNCSQDLEKGKYMGGKSYTGRVGQDRMYTPYIYGSCQPYTLAILMRPSLGQGHSGAVTQKPLTDKNKSEATSRGPGGARL